jgi:iron complex outermembrane recepter protein
MQSFIRRGTMVLATAACLTSGAGALAQDSAPVLELDEIIVTARRVEEKLQEVPLAIRVLGEDTIAREGIARLEDVARLVPGVTFDLGAFPNDTRPAIRGMQAERGRPSVAVLLDGMDVSGENLYIAGGSSSLNTRLVDLERIEVVKGPQSVLYGRSAFAGAINYISKRPDLDAWNGKVQAEVANGGTRGVTASLSGPIVTDKLAVRFNVASNERDGFYRNSVTGENLGAEETLGGAVSVLFQPTESLSFLARYQYVDDEFSQAAAAYIGATVDAPVPGGTFSAFQGAPASPCPANLAGVTAAVFAACTRRIIQGEIRAAEGDVQLSADPFRGVYPGIEQQQENAFLEAKLSSGFGDFTLNFSWLRNDAHNIADGDYNNIPQPLPTVGSLNAEVNEIYANQHRNWDLRWANTFGAVDVILGVQKFDELSTLLSSSQFWLRNPNSIFGGPPFFFRRLPTATVDFPGLYSRDSDYIGYYGSLQWQINDALRLAVEGRYNRDDIDYFTSGFTRLQVAVQQLVPMCPATPGGASSCGLTANQTQSKFTPRVSLDWKLREGAMTYVTYAKGYKPGGYNVNEVTDLSSQGYQAENVDTYEIGAKTEWLDNRLVINGAFFYNDYTDQQVGVQRVDPSGQTLSAIANAGNVEIKGFEIETSWRATEHVTVAGSYAWTDAEYTEFVIGERATALQRAEAGNATGDFAGKAVQRTPEHALNASVEYRGSLDSGLGWFTELAGSYRSKRFVDEANLSTMPAYSLVDLRAGLVGERWSATLFVNNVLDDDRIKNAQRFVDVGRPEGGFAPGRAILAYLPLPRVYGLRADFRF